MRERRPLIKQKQIAGRLGVSVTEALVRRRILKPASAEGPAPSLLDNHPVTGAPASPIAGFRARTRRVMPASRAPPAPWFSAGQARPTD